jgi:hypothetical protein
MDEDKMVSLASVGCTKDEKLIGILSQQSDEEASYDQIWQ